MFVKSFLSFRKILNKDNNENLLLENKEQALSILKKRNIDEGNLDFNRIKKRLEKTFNSLNYLGLLTKFKFEQDVSTQELIDLIPWLKESGNKLPKNALQYKEFEHLKDDIIVIDNKQRVRTLFNILPRLQKNLVQGSRDFAERALEIHKLGLINEFKSKISLYKTREDIINYMDIFIEKNSDEISFSTITNDLRSMDAEIIHEDNDRGLVLAEILNYKTSKKLGSTDWCISYDKSHWDSYTSGTKKQYFLWDFSLNRTSAFFLIGFTTNGIGQIVNIHDKFDKSLSSGVPTKIKDLLKEIDVSTDPFEYKLSLINKSNANPDSIERIKYKSDSENVLIFKLNGSSGYNNIKSEGWDRYYDPFHNKKITMDNIYAIFDFNYQLNESNFAYLVSINDTEVSIVDNVNNKGKFNISDLNLTGFIYDLYTDGYLKVKSRKEYNRQIDIQKKEIFEDSDDAYLDDYKADQYGEVLYDFLIDKKILSEDGDEDDDVREINIHRKYLIYEGRDHYGLFTFKLFTNEMITNIHNNTKEWALGDEDEVDRAFTEYLNRLIDEVGIMNMCVRYVLTDNLDGESVANEYGDDSYYFEESIRDSPESYGIEPVMSEKDQEILNDSIEEMDEIQELIDNKKELRENTQKKSDDYSDYVLSKLDKIDEIKSKITDDQNRIDRLEIIKTKLVKKHETNSSYIDELIEELDTEIDELTDRLDDLDSLIREMEDVNNDTYWKLDEDEIDKKITELNDELYEEIKNDPIGYFEDRGYDDDYINGIIEYHIDIDGVIEDIKNTDGRGNSLSGYDGIEHEYNHNGELYYIYRVD